MFSTTEALMPICNTPIFKVRNGFRVGVLLHGITVTVIENDSKRDIFRNLVIIHLIIRVFIAKDIILLLMRSQSLGVKLCLNDNRFESPPSSVPSSAISP